MCLAVIEGRTLDSLEIEFSGGMERKAKSPFQMKLQTSSSFMN